MKTTDSRTVFSRSLKQMVQVARLAGLGLAVLGTWAHAGAPGAPGARVPTAVAQIAPMGGYYEIDGLIQPVKQSTVSAQASGRVTSLVVKAGDPVRKGQLLATIDDQEAAVGVQRSQAQINQADAELRNAQAQYERTKDLQSKGFVSKAALDVVDAQFKSAQAQRAQAGASAQQSGLAQRFTKVVASFDGYVLQTQVEAGDLAVPGKPLLVIYAPLSLRAVVQVPASRAQWVRTATSVQVQVAGEAAAEWIAPVGMSAVPSSDPVSQTTEWRLELPAAASAKMLPGQQTRVRFTPAQSSTRSGLTVPEAAILRRGELTAVYVVAGNTFALRAVRVGVSGTAQGAEILAGLQVGERVALDPLQAGMPGATPAAPAPTPAPTTTPINAK